MYLPGPLIIILFIYFFTLKKDHQITDDYGYW